MSTGLHSKIEIFINGDLIDTREFDDTVENLTIGSDSSANICIDVDGVQQMHAVVTISDSIALLSGLGDDILVNGTAHDPTSPLKNGDEVQIGAATLRWNITDLRAEDVTDPGVQTAHQALHRLSRRMRVLNGLMVIGKKSLRSTKTRMSWLAW